VPPPWNLTFATEGAPMAGPILLCDDGSEAADQAMRAAARLLAGRDAIALHVWRPLSAGALLAANAGLALPPDVDEQVAATAARTADHAADRARQAGFRAEPLAVQTMGPVWQAVLDAARVRDAAVIVLGARGLSGVQHALLGSVSERVVRHADRPVLVLHATAPADERPGAAGARAQA
jgi:nucleotide-binding universal stress UspA family protein